MANRISVPSDIPVTTYTTRHLEVALLARLRLLAVMQEPNLTLEFALNEALRKGLAKWEKEMGWEVRE